MGEMKALYIQVKNMVDAGKAQAAREFLVNVGWSEVEAMQAIAPIEAEYVERKRQQAQRENARRVNRREPEQEELPGLRRRTQINQ